MNNEFSSRKKDYLLKTLSRTKRKDYENYVINAIWNRINNRDIEIVSQQYVESINSDGKRSHYFIDLYFPALNIAIECDEAFHKDNIENDKKREADIRDVMYRINKTDYELYRIDASLPYDQFEKQIDDVVNAINKKIKEVNPPKWIADPEEYFSADKSYITIDDRIGFMRIDQACKILFNATPPQKGTFTLNAFQNHPELADYELWFPQMSIIVTDENGNEKIVGETNGWQNILSEDGMTITEMNDNGINPVSKSRITFIRYRDPIVTTKYATEYRFIGIFKQTEVDGNKAIYRRIDDKCPLLKA